MEITDLPVGIRSFSESELGSFNILTESGIAYADAEPGEPLALFGSAGRLEIAIRDGKPACTDEFQG